MDQAQTLINYRQTLRSVLEQKVRKNPALSMRSLAAIMGINQSGLSQVLAGKKNLSPEMAHRIATRLGMGPRGAERFALQVQAETTRDPSLKEALNRRLRLRPSTAVSELSGENFRLIADWYHFVVLRLTELHDFDPSPDKIAERVGITRFQAEAAFERLKLLGFLEVDPTRPGRWRRVRGNVRATSENVPSAAMRSFHRAMLRKSEQSLESQAPSERITRSEILGFSATKLAAARRITEDYVAQMTELAESPSDGPNQEVYELGIQLFRLTREKK
jgi:uncharacterized protein (TIGR02147 family)